MKIKGIHFKNVFNSSGARGFNGEGWWFHKILAFLFSGFCPQLLAFKSKTATWNPRDGNMAKGKFAWLKNLFPACVVIRFWQRAALNKVNLTNIGITNLIRKGKWQKKRQPFVISVMAVGATREERLEEMRKIVQAIKELISLAPWLIIALEINISCPNTEHCTIELSSEVLDYLNIASALNIPIMVKLNIYAKYKLVKAIQDSGLCDCLVVTNTLPWGSFWNLIPWKRIFGSITSPLEKKGFGKDAGGLSGPWIFPFLVDWVYRMRGAGITMLITAGGGIIRQQDILLLKLAGANAIEFSVGHFFFRPWAMKKDLAYAEQIFQE
jgi:dihydroorotate dehydrogenase